MTQWRITPAGLLMPAKPTTWPRPAGWENLPADVRAAWDARWARARATAQQ